MLSFLSLVGFILVIIGLKGIKYQESYGQKTMLAAQVCWLIAGILQNNWPLIGQSIYLAWYVWTTDRMWYDKGYYNK